MAVAEKITRFQTITKLAEAGGGPERIARQHEQGKYTARERIAKLLDPGSFTEIGKFVTHQCADFGMREKKIPGDGVITGYGTINGRQVFIFAQDFTVFGGSASLMHTKKICRIMELALKCGAPLVGLNESGGARIQEGVASLNGYAEIVRRNTGLSGVVPQISAMVGACTGGAAYSPAITDFIMMVKGISHMFVTGPEVIKAAIHEEVTRDELGSAEVHAEKTGVAHFALEDEDHLFATIRDLLGFLPQNNQELPPRYPATDDPNREEEAFETIVPANPNQPYDMHDFISLLVDDGHFLEVHEHFATNMITGFARLDGRTVGIVANQPAILAGCVDILAAEKAGRFVRLCDVFNIPILTLADVSGFLPGVTQEHGGIIRRAAKMPYAYAEATVPKITLILRKAYGGGYGVMCCKPLGADINLAYPSAEIAVMGSEGAVNVLFGKQLKKAKDPEAMRQRLLAEYRETFAHPYKAAEIGTIDGVIHPRKTRPILIRHLRMLENKRVFNPEKKHGNMPF